jgi:hypothetical protein
MILKKVIVKINPYVHHVDIMKQTIKLISK